MSHTIKEFILPLSLNVQKTVWRMPILMLGVKGYCCKCGPFRLLRSDLEKKRYFWVVHASKSLTYGKDTKRIIHVAEVVDRVSEDIMLHFAFVSILKTHSCSWLHVKYFLQTLVVERKKKWRVCHRWLNQLGDANNGLFYSKFYPIPVYRARNYGNDCVPVLS